MVIRNFDLLDIQENKLILEATISTGSKVNLNTVLLYVFVKYSSLINTSSINLGFK